MEELLPSWICSPLEIDMAVPGLLVPYILTGGSQDRFQCLLSRSRADIGVGLGGQTGRCPSGFSFVWTPLIRHHPLPTFGNISHFLQFLTGFQRSRQGQPSEVSLGIVFLATILGFPTKARERASAPGPSFPAGPSTAVATAGGLCCTSRWHVKYLRAFCGQRWHE